VAQVGGGALGQQRQLVGPVLQDGPGETVRLDGWAVGLPQPLTCAIAGSALRPGTMKRCGEGSGRCIPRSVKRVASAIGEGAIAVQLLHRPDLGTFGKRGGAPTSMGSACTRWPSGMWQADWPRAPGPMALTKDVCVGRLSTENRRPETTFAVRRLSRWGGAGGG
jgi:hypothetical protein